MKLIVGLGNPGRKYEGTRHNLGFEVLRHVARQAGLTERDFRQRFDSFVAITQWGDETVLLQMPQTYMNLSGQAVATLRGFYRLEINAILVVCDDLNLELSQLRFRPSGSAGGQKGLADIIRKLGTDEIARLRLGIGGPPPNWDAADYVLAKFLPEESPDVRKMIDRAAEAVRDWVTSGIELCMNRYNTKLNN